MYNNQLCMGAKNEFDVYVYIKIAEKTIESGKDRGFSSTVLWCEYLHGYLNSRTNLNLLNNEFIKVMRPLQQIFGLSISESMVYIVDFYKSKLWVKYLPYAKASLQIGN